MPARDLVAVPEAIRGFGWGKRRAWAGSERVATPSGWILCAVIARLFRYLCSGPRDAATPAIRCYDFMHNPELGAPVFVGEQRRLRTQAASRKAFPTPGEDQMAEEMTIVLAMHRGPARVETISSEPAWSPARSAADALATWWQLSPPIDKFMDALFLGTSLYSGPAMASVGKMGMLSLRGVVHRVVYRIRYGLSGSRLAREYQRLFGEAPDAIHLVGSHAWKPNLKPTSDIDLLFETSNAQLQKLAGAWTKRDPRGFELFKRANPGRIRSHITHQNFEGLAGSNPGLFQVAKAQTIDPFVGALSPKPALRIW